MDTKETEQAVKELRKSLRKWVSNQPTAARQRVARRLRFLLTNRDGLDAIVVALRQRAKKK